MNENRSRREREREGRWGGVTFISSGEVGDEGNDREDSFGDTPPAPNFLPVVAISREFLSATGNSRSFFRASSI